MSVEKEKLLLSYLVNDPNLFTRVNHIVHPKYFDPELQRTVTFVKEYFESYKGLPTAAQLYAEHKIVLPEVQGIPSEIKYAETELETFCRDKAIEHAIYASVGLLKEQKLGEIERLIRDAITVSLQRHLGTDYFADPDSRLHSLATQSVPIPTKFKRLDDALGGGLPRKGMIIFAAPSGVGKSLTMSNVARNLVLQGLHGIYFTLELYPDRFTALKAEAASIFAESPHYNKDRPERFERLWWADLTRREHDYPVLWLGELVGPAWRVA
jgi:hypothetical protein